MKKPGRPAIPARERRSIIVPVRLKPREEKEIRRNAKRAGYTVSEWIREFSLGWK